MKKRIRARIYSDSYKYKGYSALMMSAALGLSWFFYNDVLSLFVNILLFASALGFFLSVPHFFRKSNTWEMGAIGEEIVADEVAKLSGNYRVLNDILLPGEKGNIDHIVIGENGIFVIETKNHVGKISCDGDQWEQKLTWTTKTYHGRIFNPSSQVKRKVEVLENFIEREYGIISNLPILPVVVFTNKEAELKIKNTTVPVLKIKRLIGFIKNYKSKISLSGKKADSIAKLIDKYNITLE